jgi:hypothetical protein
MQVEAIYEHGRIEFAQPMQLKHDRVRVIVDVPDEEIVSDTESYNLPPEVFERAEKMRSRLDAVRHAPRPSDDQLPPVSAKTLERIEAFALREDR